jgi:hypothetical protein
MGEATMTFRDAIRAGFARSEHQNSQCPFHGLGLLCSDVVLM